MTPIPILLYHSVCDRPTGQFGPYTVTRSQFARHLDVVQDLGYTTLTIGHLMKRRDEAAAAPDRVAVITVDDGFRDFEDNAWPELSARNIPATLYVVSGTIGGHSDWLAPLGAARLPMLTTQQLRDLAADGCEIGGHSQTHPQLDCLPHARAHQEIRESKAQLADALGQEVSTFAYPHGYHDKHVRRCVIEAGFKSATAVRNALSHDRDDRFALARVTVTSDFDAQDLTRALSGNGVGLARGSEQWRTRAYRHVRRSQYRRAARQGLQ